MRAVVKTIIALLAAWLFIGCGGGTGGTGVVTVSGSVKLLNTNIPVDFAPVTITANDNGNISRVTVTTDRDGFYAAELRVNPNILALTIEVEGASVEVALPSGSKGSVSVDLGYDPVAGKAEVINVDATQPQTPAGNEPGGAADPINGGSPGVGSPNGPLSPTPAPTRPPRSPRPSPTLEPTPTPTVNPGDPGRTQSPTPSPTRNPTVHISPIPPPSNGGISPSPHPRTPTPSPTPTPTPNQSGSPGTIRQAPGGGLTNIGGGAL